MLFLSKADRFVKSNEKNNHMLKSTYKTVRSDIMRTCMNTCDIIPADTIMCSAGMILIYNPTLRMNGRMDGWMEKRRKDDQ